MGHILHDWDLDEKRSLLPKAYEALPAGGALIVYEAIIDDDRRENAFGLLMSLNMLIETPGGFDYTGADCRGWMAKAGFRESYVEHLVGPGLDGRRHQVALRSVPGGLDFLRNGASRARTGDLLGAIQALSQLSYSPESGRMFRGNASR